MNHEQPVPATQGVTVQLLATVDLGPEIEGMAGRQLRMRMVTIEPGGVFGPLHNHQDRPGTVYILQGTITVSVRPTHLERKPFISQDRVHTTDRAHHAQRIRDFQILNPTHASDVHT